MSWEFLAHNKTDAASIDRLGNTCIAGNGSIGLRGTLDEYGKAEKTAVIINGLYDKVGNKWREPVNAPNPCLLQLIVDGHVLRADSPRCTSHMQGLNFRTGIQFRETEFAIGSKPGSGPVIRIASRRFVSAVHERLICAEYTFTADRDCHFVCRSGIDGDVWDLNGPHLEACSSGTHNAGTRKSIVWLKAFTHEKQRAVTVCEYTDIAIESMGDGAVQSPEIVSGERFVCRDFSIAAKAGVRYRVTKYAVVWDDGKGDDKTAFLFCADMAEKGFDFHLAGHMAVWHERWERCDIVIHGDDEAQLALRFSMYHLLAIAPFFGGDLSIPARGLSGQVYKGGIFWDTEIFMVPFFINAFPEVARTLVRYRIQTLDGARRKAAEYGYRGAFYAWESQDTGDDACTHYNVNDVITGRPMRTFFRDKQVHISADIPFALWQYIQLTGDESILTEGGAEVIYECARFFSSWIYFKPEKDRYEVLDVTGPDEYHERVNNNFFTNLMVAHTFEICLAVDDLLVKKFPALRNTLLAKLNMEREIFRLKEIAGKLYVPSPGKNLLISQFDGYFDLEDPLLADVLAKKLHEHEYLGGGNGLARWTQILKQADVVLGLCLFRDRYERNVKQANWEYYLPRTEHGSSLSACAYAMAAAELGKSDWAYSYFMKTATVDLTGEGKQYVGDLYIGGTHPAANGGAWLSVYRGFCGISVGPGYIRIEPQLPGKWTSVGLTVRNGKNFVRVTIEHGIVKITKVKPAETGNSGSRPPGLTEAAGPAPGLRIIIGDKSYDWDGSETLNAVLPITAEVQ